MSTTGSSSGESANTRDPYRDNFSLTFSFFENKTVKWREDKRKISKDTKETDVHPLQTAKIVGSTCSKNLLLFAEKNGTIHSLDTIHYQHGTFQAFDKSCMAVKILTKYEIDEAQKTSKKTIFDFATGGQSADPVLIQYLLAIGSDKAPKEEKDDTEDEDAFVREEVFKVKVFEMRHEAFRTIFEERYFFYLLPNKNNNGPRKTVKNLKGDLGVACFEVSDDFKNMAVYLSNAKQAPLNIYGEIIFFKMEGNQTFCVEKPSSVPTPVRVTVNTSTEITNIGFLRIPGGGYNLFATTETSLYNCIISERFASINRLNFSVIDPRVGANLHCATVRLPSSSKSKSKSPASFLVANKAGLFAYGEDAALQRSEDRVMEGVAPTMVLNDCNYATSAAWYRNYLVLTIKRDNDYTLKVYELNNRFVCHEYELSSLASSYMLGNQSSQPTKLKPTYQVLEVLPMYDMADIQASGAIYLLVREMRAAPIDDEVPQESTNLLIRLREKPIDVQLDLLIKKYKFTYALDLAKESNTTGLDVEIRKKYGDYRFSLGQYRRAINQYVLTIGKLEPSYVIRKFLDETNSKNQYLIQYLYALHRENAFNNDHTTLLLNCFMRLDENAAESGEFAREMKLLYKKETEEGDGVEKTEDVVIDDLAEQAPDAAMQNLLRLVQMRDKASILKMFMDSHDTLHYDPETVIKVLRQNGYREEARKLAERFAKERNDIALHDWVIQINIEDAATTNDKSNLRRALRHIESLQLPLAKHFSKKYAKPLLVHLPHRTTNLLIRLCTDLYRPIPAYNDAAENVADLRRVFVLPEYKRIFYSMCGTEYSLEMEEYETQDVQNVRATIDTKELAKPSDYIFAFVDQPFWLMVFLEVVTTYAQMNNPTMNPSLQRRTNEIDGVVYNTLLELYLRYWDNDFRRLRKVVQEYNQAPLVSYSDPERTDPVPDKNEYDSEFYYQIFPVERNQLEESYEQKAKTLIERDADQYDPNHALMLCQSKNFEYGILYLYKRMNLKYDILRYYMEIPIIVEEGEASEEEFDRRLTEKFDKILETAYEYGDDDANVWIQVLSFFCTGKGSKFTKATDYITKVLARIKEKDVLPPLLVVKILSKNNTIKVAHLRDYLYSKLHRDQEKTKEQIKTIKELQKETTKLNVEIEELRRNAQIFQSTQCAQCSKALNLPSVHFMCMHSYHQRCLENDSCLKCSEKNKVYIAELEKMKRNKDAKTGIVQEKIETFTQQLNNAKQGFEALANQFGTGLFTQAQYEDFNDEFLLRNESDRLIL